MRIATMFLVIMCATALLAATPLKKAEVRYAKDVPVMVKGLNVPLKADAASVEKFVKSEFFPQFNLGKDITLVPFRAMNLDGTKVFKYSHSYKGWAVENAFTTVSMKNGKVYRINNGLGRIDLDLTKVVAPEKAVMVAAAKHFPKSITALPKHMVEKVIVQIGGVYMPAYKVRLMPFHMADNRVYYINAKSGKFLYAHNKTMYADDDALLTDESVTALDTAKVYTKNPITTPDLVEVTLPWVADADDADLTAEERGFLTTKKDSEEIRKIKAFNCPDKGEKFPIELGGFSATPHLCSPVQLANKIDNGSFIYEDCEGGKEYVKENMAEGKIDKCAEISMYYHASKIYQYLRQLDTDFSYLLNNNTTSPLNVIGNFQMPDTADLMAVMGGTNELVPMDNAFFSPDNPMMSILFASSGITGDLLVFGQGTFADFGFDGDVIYHEFGHATVYTTGLDSGGFLDQYGMNGEPGALHEGFGDTFSFFMSDDPCTGEYASQGIIDWAKSQGGIVEMDKDENDNWCMRYAEHEYKVMNDFEGEVHWDGQPHLATNWAIYKLAQKDKIGGATLQEQKDAFVKLLLKTLYALGTAQGTHKLWAETLLSEIENDDAYKTHKAHIEQLLTDFNYFAEIRSRDASAGVKRLFQDAAVDPDASSSSPLGGGGTAIQVLEDETPVSIAPGYIQLTYTVPEDFEFNSVKIIAGVASSSSSSPIGGSGGTPDLHIYAKKGSPIIFTVDAENSTDTAVRVTVDFDQDIVKDEARGAWFLTDVKPGEKYYLEFINYGTGGATISGIALAGADYEATTDDDSILNDGIATDEDDIAVDNVIVPDTDTTTKKSDDGCGCSIVF
ncbi:MAG TPA: hypothetical protein PLV42_00770 [bacterium]|nr:hypothetical protein [bacterium]